MNKLLLAAGALAAVLFVAGPSAAQAGSRGGVHVDADVHLTGHRHHSRLRHHRRHVRRFHDVMPRWQVVRVMRRNGYRHCRGVRLNRRGIYSLRCVRNGRLFAVRVNGWNGRVINRWRIS